MDYYLINDKGMLIDLQRNNLNKLLQRYDFEYLKPSKDVYSIVIPQEQHFVQNVTDEKRRRIFYNVAYTAQEVHKIEQIKALLKKHQIKQQINDELILKHIYGGKWSNGKIIERIQKFIMFNTNQAIIRLDQQTIAKLERGSIYAYGCDRNKLPILVMRVDKVDFSKGLQQIFNLAYYLILVVKQYKMVPYHAEKYVLIFDFNNISFTSIPYIQLYSIISLMGIYYCGLSERTFLYNSSGIGNAWKIIYSFLPQYQKNKIIFIQQGEEKNILEYIDQFQLEKKYGGKLPNLQAYWPPKNTHEELVGSHNLSQSYYSAQNNQQFFQDCGQTSSSCCKDCTIY